MKPREKRAIFIVAIIISVSIAAVLITNAFKQNLVFFFTPTQIYNNEAPKNVDFRVGGLVKQDSIKRDKESLDVYFIITDTDKEISVSYKGILPDLFKEGKGVVAQGKLNDNGVFVANNVLAKHDENYMPPEAAEALKKAKQNKTK